MTISNVPAGIGIASAVNFNVKPAISAGLESNVSEGAQKGSDSVSISKDAKEASVRDSIATQSEDIYQKIKNSDFILLQSGKKLLSENLPENQPVVNQLKQQMESAVTNDKKAEIGGLLGILQQYGYEEYFPDVQSVIDKQTAHFLAMDRRIDEIAKQPEQVEKMKQKFNELVNRYEGNEEAKLEALMLKNDIWDS